MKLQRLLYVEDEADIREIAAIALQELGGFELTLCKQGEDAAELALQTRPQLILLDVMMPRMDGIATFQALRQEPELAAIPVIFLTAKAQKREMAELLELGALGVIPKPFEPLSLADQVRTLWGQHGSD